MQFQENARTEWRKNRQTLFHRTLPATARGPINKHGMECKLFNIKRRKVLALSIWTHFKYSSCVSIVDLHKGNSGWGTGEYNISLNGAPNIVVMWVTGMKIKFQKYILTRIFNEKHMYLGKLSNIFQKMWKRCMSFFN